MDLEKIKTGIKRFFSNPNTLTFLLVIVLIVIIYVVYSYMINRAIAPVTVPYCTKKALSMNEITDEYISTVKISGNFVTANGSGLVQNTRNVKNKYVAPGYFIPENSFFYTEALADSSIQEKTSFSDLPDDYTIYNLPVTFHSTYGSSIMPGNYIDLYFKAKDPDNDKKIIFGKFIESIRVLKVIDKDGLDVFTESTKDDSKPKEMWFAVPSYYHELLRLCEDISELQIEIIPVPRNSGYSESPKETQIVNTAIENLILDKASTKQ